MANKSSTAFDGELLVIPHYSQYPAMLPFVGPDYVSLEHTRLLLIAESNYLPKTSTIHADPTCWYSSRQSALTSEEIDHINCRGLLQCAWDAYGHRIYSRLNDCIGAFALQDTGRPISNIAFMNAFQRPAVSGQSFKGCCCDDDVNVSMSVITSVINVITPDMVIFVSKYAWDKVGRRIESNTKKRLPSVFFDSVCHPSGLFASWEKPDGKRKFMDLLRGRFCKLRA